MKFSPEHYKAAYEAGATIEELALDEGCSTPAMASVLHQLGTDMRPAKPRVGSKKSHSIKDIKNTSTGISSTHRTKTARTGHRRRGY